MRSGQGTSHHPVPRGRKTPSAGSAPRASTAAPVGNSEHPMARKLTRKKRQPSSSPRAPAHVASGPFARPEFAIPDLPLDITVVSDDRLMQLFSEYVQWQNYAA